MLTLIVACAKGRAIGRDNTIPWYAPEDLAFFQRETMGAAVIMGRNTWDSLPFKPLKNRLNIVVSSRDVGAEHRVASIEDALALAKEKGHARVYGMGGAGIYGALLPLADRLLITEVDMEVPDADTYFPAFNPQDWRLVQKFPLRPADPACVLHEWMRA